MVWSHLFNSIYMYAAAAVSAWRLIELSDLSNSKVQHLDTYIKTTVKLYDNLHFVTVPAPNPFLICASDFAART